MKVLIVADSNGMPRNEISYEETWVYKLINSLPAVHFIDRSRRASTVERLVTEGGDVKNVKLGADLLEYYNPDVAVLQLGIVDCSPRYVNKNNIFIKLLYKSPKKIQSVIFSLIKKYTVRSPKYAFVSETAFRKALEEYATRALQTNTKVLAITIAPVTEVFVHKSPHIRTSIVAYNNIYNDISTKFSNFFVVDPFSADINIDAIALDEFHINAAGNTVVFENVKKALQKLI